MQFFRMIALTGIAIGLGAAQFARAEEWRTITPDVIYGHKAGMALTYDVIQPVKNAKGVGILFMMSGGWVSQWGPPKNIVRPELKSPNLFEKIVDHGYTLIIVRHGAALLQGSGCCR